MVLLEIFEKFIYKIFDKSPYFISKIISSFILLFIKYEKLEFNNDYKGATKDLLFLDYDNAIGDFICLIKLLYSLEKENKNFDVVVHKKFKGILEIFNFKNFEIIYKENDLGNHYIQKKNENWMNVINESKEKKLSYRNIYYFNKTIKLDSLFFFLNINYDHIIKLKSIWKNKKKNAKWLQRKSFVYSLYFLVNKKKFKIIEKGYRKLIDSHIIDYSYWIINDVMPNPLASTLDLHNYFPEQNTNNQTAIIMLSNEPRGKSLKTDVLLSYLNDNFINYSITFVGNGTSQMQEIEKHKDLNFKIINKINQIKTIKDLLYEVNKNNIVLSYDTCLFHIAMLLNKKTYLFVNKKHPIVKFEFCCWLQYKNDNVKTFKLPKKMFINLKSI